MTAAGPDPEGRAPDGPATGRDEIQQRVAAFVEEQA